jgi:hypothetical protein
VPADQKVNQHIIAQVAQTPKTRLKVTFKVQRVSKIQQKVTQQQKASND